MLFRSGVSSASSSEDLSAESSKSYARVVDCELSRDGLVVTLEMGLGDDRVQYRDVALELQVDILGIHTTALAFTASLASTDAALASGDGLSRSMVSSKDNDHYSPASFISPLHSRLSDSVPAFGKDSEELKFAFNPHADRKSTRLNSSHSGESRMPSSA